MTEEVRVSEVEPSQSSALSHVVLDDGNHFLPYALHSVHRGRYGTNHPSNISIIVSTRRESLSRGRQQRSGEDV
jgi:hypothetical protein